MSKNQLSKMHDFLITHTIGLYSLTLLRVCDLNANLSHLSKSNVFVRKSAFSRKYRMLNGESTVKRYLDYMLVILQNQTN